MYLFIYYLSGEIELDKKQIRVSYPQSQVKRGHNRLAFLPLAVVWLIMLTQTSDFIFTKLTECAVHSDSIPTCCLHGTWCKNIAVV